MTYSLSYPKSEQAAPIIISIPHAGTHFPTELHPFYTPEILHCPQDTDWFVDRLYDFSHRLAISQINANLSRYVVDLNRAPDNKALYNDGRHNTGLVPTTCFNGQAVYLDGYTLSENEINQRLTQYYWPYYRALQSLIDTLRKQHRNVLLFDAHSIKRRVPTINSEPLPSLILGNQNHTTAHKNLINVALEHLRQSPYEVSDNKPFRGGNITRHFAHPSQGIHCLQLEMAQDIYMNENTLQYEVNKANQVKTTLNELMLKLIECLHQL